MVYSGDQEWQDDYYLPDEYVEFDEYDEPDGTNGDSGEDEDDSDDYCVPPDEY